MAYITAAELRAAIAARLGLTGPADLPAHWAGIAADAVDDGYYTLRSILMGRGFTSAEIDGWEARATWNRKLSLCAAFREAALQDDDASTAVESLCKCEETLATLAIVVGGEVLNPSGGNTRIGYGDYATTDDIHTIDDEL